MDQNERIQIKSAPKLFDVVELLADHAELKAGALGTIVEELPPAAYIVEFCDKDGRTITLETLQADDISVHA